MLENLLKFYHFESAQNLASFLIRNLYIFCLFLIFFAAETGIVLNLILNFKQNKLRVSIKLFLQKTVYLFQIFKTSLIRLIPFAKKRSQLLQFKWQIMRTNALRRLKRCRIKLIWRGKRWRIKQTMHCPQKIGVLSGPIKMWRIRRILNLLYIFLYNLWWLK